MSLTDCHASFSRRFASYLVLLFPHFHGLQLIIRFPCCALNTEDADSGRPFRDAHQVVSAHQIDFRKELSAHDPLKELRGQWKWLPIRLGHGV